MKTHSKTALFSLLLASSLWQTAAYADTHASDGSSKTQPVEPWHPHIYELKPVAQATPTEADSNTPGLKLGAKNKIELYGTVEIGYSKWSQKN